jgi:uncharacterized protein YndB with AHSA1/START domain
MPDKKDQSGRRFVQAETEVPGTPEEVWQAIATGPGISAWFVPSTVEERVGGVATSNFGPGMESQATVTAWEPPRRLAMESHDMGPGSPPVATEWTVEAKQGGTCVVRVVHSWTRDDDEWDKMFEGHEHGWPGFFRILRTYLTHFAGKQSAAFQVMVTMPSAVNDVWSNVRDGLALGAVREGQRFAAAGGPTLAGVVERVGPAEHPELLLRLDQPAAGTSHLFAMPMGGQACLALRFYFYGADAAKVAAREEPLWQQWADANVTAPLA